MMVTALDLAQVHQFVKATGEANIRKMMTGGKMTAAHVGLLLKLVRSLGAEDFGKHFEANTLPRGKYSDQESAIKESFWKTAPDTFVQLGLVNETKAA